jgi:hypothetical protein
VTVPEAASTLRELQIRPSSPIHEQVARTQPQVVQVWFEPDVAATPAPVPTTPQLAILGGTKIGSDQITWAAAAAGTLPQALSVGGRVQIRVHCGHLIDANLRVFSGSADAATGFDSGVRPAGGIFESWFFVRRG